MIYRHFDDRIKGGIPSLTLKQKQGELVNISNASCCNGSLLLLVLKAGTKTPGQKRSRAQEVPMARMALTAFLLSSFSLVPHIEKRTPRMSPPFFHIFERFLRRGALSSLSSPRSNSAAVAAAARAAAACDAADLAARAAASSSGPPGTAEAAAAAAAGAAAATGATGAAAA